MVGCCILVFASWWFLGISCSGSGFGGVVVCFGYSLLVLRDACLMRFNC